MVWAETTHHRALSESFFDSMSGVEVHGFLCGGLPSVILLLEYFEGECYFMITGSQLFLKVLTSRDSIAKTRC